MPEQTKIQLKEELIDKIITCVQDDNIPFYSNKVACVNELLDSILKQQREEERQFILNILDGIDKADEEMGNSGGGTKAIRFALQSRI